MHTSLVGLLLLAAAACAGADIEEDPPMTEDGYVLIEPTLDSIAPTQVRLGDTVKVFGTDFIDKKHGDLALLLDGTYLDSEGAEHAFTGEVQLDVLNSSVAEFKFEEVFFHPTRDKIGTWRGTAMLVNRMPLADDFSQDDEMWSDAQDVSIRIDPSIKIERLRSADAANCSLVTSGTNTDNNLELGFKAIGFGEATPSNPWTVRVSFVTPDVKVLYVVPETFNFWPIDEPIDDSVSTEGQPGNHRIEFQMDAGTTVILDPTKTARTVKINPAVTIGQGQYNEVVLGMLKAGQVEFGNMRKLNFMLEITTADGRSLRRLVTMDAWAAFEVGLWTGVEKLAERYSPHAVSGCIPGGIVGGELSYSEGESESRSRSVGVRWDASTSSTLGFSVSGGTGVGSPVSFQVGVESSNTWTQSFGVDINESVSSESHQSQNLQIHLLPSFYGMSYRQLERRERSVEVVFHNDCGVSGVVGEAVLTNWNFAFDITQGQECPPDTNLPPAEVF